MAKADRLERIDVRRMELEAEYSAALVAALRVTALGSWGLFDHQQDRRTRAKMAPVIENLEELGTAIDALRTRLGMAAFDMHLEFLRSRGTVRSSEVGEPKQAQAWLDRLGIAAC